MNVALIPVRGGSKSIPLKNITSPESCIFKSFIFILLLEFGISTLGIFISLLSYVFSFIFISLDFNSIFGGSGFTFGKFIFI